MGFWQRAEVCAALDRRDVGRLFRLLRQFCGASQTRIGAAVGLSQGAVSPIMNGNQAVTALLVMERIADGLDMPDDARMRLGLAPREADLMRRRTALGIGLLSALSPAILADVLSESAAEALELTREHAVSSVGRGTLDHLSTVAAQLYRSYPGRPAAELFPVVRAYRQRVGQLIDGKHTLREARELYVRAADLSDLMSELALDLGSPVAAEAWAIDAYRHADQAGHGELCAWASGNRSTLALEAGDPARAAETAEHGVARAPRHSPMGIRLRARAAQAHADDGNRQACLDLLAEARQLCDQLPDRSPSRLTTENVEYTSHSLAASTAGSYLRLADWKAAERHARVALSARTAIPGWAEQAELDLAIALANLGSPDEAAEHGGQALGTVGWLANTLHRAQELDTVLTSRYPEESAAKSFHEHYRQLISA